MNRKLSAMILVLALLLPAAAFGQTVLKLAHLNAQQPFDVASAAMAAVFKSEVEANSNGQIKVELYPNGVLGKAFHTTLDADSDATTGTGSCPVATLRASPFSQASNR